jgi:uncharacterized membrane protein YgaE (UPF0421/DUF939 family)
MTAARIARRLVRKLAKPIALYLANMRVAEAEAQADHYCEMRSDLVVMELSMRRHAVQLAERRNQIAGW